MFEGGEKHLSGEELETEPQIAEIVELKEPIQKILGEMRDRIDGGQYQLIIGDDASGRVPTLIFGNVIKALYKEMRLSPPMIRFFPGSYADENWRVRGERVRVLARAKSAGAKKALIVTDTIKTGRKLLGITEALQELGMAYDIVTIGLYLEVTAKERTEEKLGGKIFYAKENYTPKIYRNFSLSGVQKLYWDTHAKPVRFSDDSESALFQKSRKSVRDLSQILIKWYKEDQPRV